MTTKPKHGIYWEIKSGQDLEDIEHWWGEPKPTEECTIPLKTIEAPDEFEKTEIRFESVRYFATRKASE